jgi:hypothetical protein
MPAANYQIPYKARTNGSTIASETLTVGTDAVAAATFSVPDTDWVVFDIVTSPVRVRWDGTAPTSTIGHKLLAGTSYQWTVGMWNAAQFIRDTTASSDATVFASPLSVD